MELIRLTIDGRPVAVGPNTTILEAAGRLGIEIPTLCHVPGLEPVSSCFLCAVQIEGRTNLTPACAMPVADAMVVTTDSDDIRAARRMALELLLSDHVGDCIAPCQADCPAGLDIPGFVHPLAAGQNRPAMEVISQRLVLPGALGRICPHVCEDHCRRCNLDESLAIAALHRFAADRDLTAADRFIPPRQRSTGKSVAIVGAGPAGLAAAYYLLQHGHDCTIFDAHRHPGGMLRYGIPEYRLPRKELDGEIDVIRRLGARFRMNKRWGDDFTLSQLRKKFDAVFLAIGAQVSLSLGCEGDELATSGVEFLRHASAGGHRRLGEHVVVVGGGNTAMDACRTAVRLGADKVTVLYRRSRDEMPCLMDEVEAAEAEGVLIEFLVAPIRLKRIDARTLRLTCQRMKLGRPDASGRPIPTPVVGSEFNLEVDTVIAAIGQSVNRAIAREDHLEVSDWGIAVDPRTLATNLPGVFAGGDAVSGPDLAVSAVAAGRLAAVSIDQYLAGQPVIGEERPTNVLMQALDEGERAALFRRIERTPRRIQRDIEMSRRRETFDEVRLGLTEADTLDEARRCMTCGCAKVDTCRLRRYATEYGADPYRFTGARRRFERDLSHPEIVYEPGKCIMCQACVTLARRSNEPLGLAIVGRGFNVAMAVPYQEPLANGLRRDARAYTALCPTGALALRTERACDLATCEGCRFFEAPIGS